MRVHDPNSGPECEGCNEKLKLVHPRLVAWFRIKKGKYPNLHIAWGWRGPEDQYALYQKGRNDRGEIVNPKEVVTYAQWPQSKHNAIGPDNRGQSQALDLFQLDEDGNDRWSKAFYARLNEENRTERSPIKWGGTFTHPDSPHFELITA